ncbi:MAG: glycosyltransferase family 4 protein [Oligoflexia bacterium]|nr:glycosyltransferase family 4 protein [Oligoflexia bacterium]
MKTKKIKVQVVYRNYIPLNSPYSSFWTHPPEGIEFIIPKPKKYLNMLFPIYQRFGNNFLVSRLVNVAQKIFFNEESNNNKKNNDIDYYFYVGMLPSKIPDRPFFIDIEHSYALLNFVRTSSSSDLHSLNLILKNVFNILKHPMCKGIVPISEAAAATLASYFGEEEYKQIKDKIKVIYPALPPYKEYYANEIDYSIISNDPKFFNIIFIGKDSYRKGLQEVLPAIDILSKKYSHLRLWVVTDVTALSTLTTKDYVQDYANHPAIRFFPCKYSSKEIITKFFLPAQLFLMPTHADTFGMVYLEALSSGIPVLLTKQFATPEIVSDGVNGLFLDHPPLFLDRIDHSNRINSLIPKERAGKDFILPEADHQQLIADIVKKIESLINNPQLLQSLAQNAPKEFEGKGKFSTMTRNIKLQELFQLS